MAAPASGQPEDPLSAAYAEAADLVARLDRDRWLASLFVPEPARRHVLAVLAFSAEVASVRDHVSQPMPGEIRLQWWRDVLAGTARGDATGHPVAAALLDTIERFNLSRHAFQNLIDARIFDLYDDPMPSLNDLEGYLGETASVLFQLCAQILSDGRDPGTADASGHAGVAYGLVGLMRGLSFHAARGQVYLPLDLLEAAGTTREDVVGQVVTPGLLAVLGKLRGEAGRHLAAARSALATAPAEVKPAFAALALVTPQLKALDKAAHAPFSGPGMAGWKKPVALWWGMRR